MELTEKQLERFWSKINIKGENECWEWTASVDNCGYGQVGIGTKKIHKTHRVAYMLFNGDFPNDLCCHSCDNPPCCNPKHLFNGTQKDNMKDCKTKGRNKPPPISSETNSILSKKQVEDIRKEYVRETYHKSNSRELALKYGVNYGVICDIISRRTWKNI